MKKLIMLLVAVCFASAPMVASAKKGHYDDDDVTLALNPETTVLYLKSDITEGHITGFECDGDCVDENGDGFPENALTIIWGYTGDVYAPEIDDDTGEQEGLGDLIGTVSGSPAFPAAFGIFQSISDPKEAATMLGTETLPWTCTGCNLVINGSTFAKIDNMPLTGRSFIGFGAVPNAEGYLALRMAGCVGIQEISGEGPYADMMGTLCLNGTIGFNPDFSGAGTSNCVVVLQEGPYNEIITEE